MAGGTCRATAEQRREVAIGPQCRCSQPSGSGVHDPSQIGHGRCWIGRGNGRGNRLHRGRRRGRVRAGVRGSGLRCSGRRCGRQRVGVRGCLRLQVGQLDCKLRKRRKRHLIGLDKCLLADQHRSKRVDRRFGGRVRAHWRRLAAADSGGQPCRGDGRARSQEHGAPRYSRIAHPKSLTVGLLGAAPVTSGVARAERSVDTTADDKEADR